MKQARQRKTALLESENVSCSVVSDSLQPHELYSLPGSFVRGILQARILEWIAIPFSKRYSQLRDQICVCCIAGRFFTSWATREAPRQMYDITYMWNIKRKNDINELIYKMEIDP